MGKTDPFKSAPVDPALVKLGFSRIKPVRNKRISMEIAARTKTGKTRFGLTMTEPIGVLNFDRSLQDILPEFPNVDVIVADFSGKMSPGEELTQKQAQMLEAEFAKAYRGLLEHRGVRSVTVDKGTTLYEIARYAEFGKASARPHHFTPVNLRMRGYLLAYQDHDKNVLFTHDLKEEWVGEQSTGRWVRDGFKYTEGLVQVNATLKREESAERDFVMTITGCAQNADLVGWEFRNDDIDFKKVAPMVLNDTKASDWR